MAFVSFDPFESLVRLQAELDRMSQRPLLDPGMMSGSNVFPGINVFSDKDGWVICAEISGIKRDDIHIDIERQRLTISGERKPEQAGGEVSYLRRERPYGSFSRSIRLPADLDCGNASATCRNGVLTIRVRRLAEARPRRVEVSAA